jgi:hypothetical protein
MKPMIELTREIAQQIGAEGEKPIPTNAAVRSLAIYPRRAMPA